ncbi:bone morphogenetic protein receptor type-2-like [Pristis pectinata]|uniref:bone morphogenetic protein receptor type-2-like n=1 Tax=Pristis pectinata TaxID=685728 RepID=UPI00223CA96E|nr:bone morphogenetic protein receptor type-2-like [Pristis pectinata]
MDVSLALSVAISLLLFLNPPGVPGDGRVCTAFPLSRNQSLGPRNGTVRCKPTDYCYGIWILHPNGELYPDRQGCWPPRNVLSCTPRCTDRSHRSHHFTSCCCSTDLCNSDPPPRVSGGGQVPSHGLSTAIICLLVILIILSTLGLMLMYPRVRTALATLSTSRCSIPPVALGCPQTVELLEVIGRGRHGVVWKGLQAQRPVAVKLFPAAHREHFHSESSFHRLESVDHENIVKFIGAGESRLGGSVDYLLVTEYCPGGSLSSYLTQHQSDWRGSLRMAQSVSAGVSFLHTETWSRGVHKPVVVHRDLSSDNVLVKEDGACVISDFGLATVMSSDKVVTTKGSPIYMVGTYRYMAPELLDGSINLGDYVTTLKQADVYSLGLILWEIFTRCTNLFAGSPVPEFQAVFQAEIGSDPTFEEMVTAVARARIRPRFPPSWAVANASLPETISDCWDQDPDARLSAQCLAHRLGDLSALSP